MNNREKIIIAIVIIVILVGMSIYFIFKNNENNKKEKEYNDLVQNLCSTTLELAVSHPETIAIDKAKIGSVEYVTFDTLSGLTINSTDKISRYIKNPKESTDNKPKYFPATTRVKLKVDNNNKVVCDGLVDIGNAPVITLLGDKAITIMKGNNFVDPGATAKDKEDGDLTKEIIKNGFVNTSVPGEYTLLYYIEDSMHNISSVERKVTVK